MSMDNVWQSPYVNVFKHFDLSSWKKASKEGEVSTLMDKTVKGTVYRIAGSVPAGNYIQLPKTNTQSLGLTGRYFYLLFKPIPSKHFVVHLDVATTDSLIIRISFSNLFKAFKSTSTWLQFPFVCSPNPGPVPSYISEAARDQSGPAPMITRWTVLCLDLESVLSSYLNRKFLYIKSVRLCANMLVKNVFTSVNLYDPGLTMAEAKRQGLMAHGICPLPRDMSFPLGKADSWQETYDWIRFPSDNGRKPFDSIQLSSPPRFKSGKTDTSLPPRRIQGKTVDVSKCVSDRVSMIHKLTAPKLRADYTEVTAELPELPTDMSQNYSEEIHVYAHPDRGKNGTTVKGKKTQMKVVKDIFPPAQATPPYKGLEPDPIMKLKRIIGFGGATFQDALWSSDGTCIVYPCHAIVVSMKISNGHQRFFIGHTDKVSCLALTNNSGLLASGQTGQMATVRVWKYSSGECLTLGKAHVHSLSCLSFSTKGSMLCGVGKDGHGKNMVVVWNTSRVTKHRELSVVAKAHTDVDITRMIIAPFDEMKMVSCGHDNVRVWRVKEGALRSAPVNLGEYHSMEFTDVCFEACALNDIDTENKLIYACTKSGHIFELDYNKLGIHHVRRLLPSKNRPARTNKIKNAEESGGALSINSMHLNDTFCVTGSDDGYLRLWPLDFAHVYLEAEHEGPVTASRLSSDGLKILAGTSMGNLGVLDVSTREYTTLMRSHIGRVLCFAVDPLRKHLATVSEDHTIRVWDAETLQQLYDFSAPDETPCTINYHPTKQLFACGFHSGTVRVFNVESTTLLAEHRQMRGEVTGLIYSPDGSRLFGCCSLGVAAIFDACTPNYKVIRVIAGLVARGEGFGPQALAVSPCGRRVAFVGPSQYTVTISDAKCLDELVRIDVSGVGPNAEPSPKMDAAVRVAFASSKSGHLLVTTANNRLIKYDARNGRQLHELSHIHRSGCSAVTVSDCGRYLATGGDKTIKVWDYDMKLDINFQVFIGHSENVSRIHFTPDGLGLISAGEAIYMWDFLAKRAPSPSIEERMELEDIEEVSTRAELLAMEDDDDDDRPSHHQYKPRSKGAKSISPRSDDIDGLSSIHGGSEADEQAAAVETQKEKKDKDADKDRDLSANDNQLVSGFPRVNRHRREDQAKEKVIDWKVTRSDNKVNSDDFVYPYGRQVDTSIRSMSQGSEKQEKKRKKKNRVTEPSGPPSAWSHYKLREKKSGVAQRRYSAPPNQAGLKLKAVIGFNSQGRDNMVWHPDTGMFAYSSGCIIVIEDLNTGEQKYLQGHMEEVNCLALQNDSLSLASASPAFQDVPCQICIWNTQTRTCSKVLTQHQFCVQCLAFSRDDRFLISVGDYRESKVVVWETNNYHMVASSSTASPIHALKWDPFTVNEFISVGEEGTVLFWLLDETLSKVCLNVHEADLPNDLVKDGDKQMSLVFTCAAYGGDSTLYVGTESGKVTAWDTRQNSCFIHWDADTAEITKLISRHSRLLTASASQSLKLWAVGGVSGMRAVQGRGSGSLTMEDEMSLDGVITAAEFDDTLDMGIVGTSAGTLWYINWSERTSIRLVSGHKNKINGVTFAPTNLLLTGGDDGSVRVWSLKNREQALQFQVLDQSCTCIAVAPSSKGFHSSAIVPLVVGGYSDGTMRVFDVNKVEMILKMQPHGVTVTAVAFSADGQMILSGSSDGVIAVSSPTTGMTVRVINDHKGVAISNIDVTLTKDIDVGVTAPTLWLATSVDRRVSIWSADWSKDYCQLVDWLSFPAPAFMPDGERIKKNDMSHYSRLPPTIARFSPDDADTIVYAGYGMEKAVHFYSLTQKKVVRTITLTHWALSLDVSSDSSLIAAGISERLLKLIDYHEGSFQDFVGHTDGLTVVKFSPNGTSLLTASHNEMFLWEVML